MVEAVCSKKSEVCGLFCTELQASFRPLERSALEAKKYSIERWPWPKLFEYVDPVNLNSSSRALGYVKSTKLCVVEEWGKEKEFREE